MTPESITAVLSLVPDGRPGIARICQEMLSEMTGVAICTPVEASAKLARRQPRRKAFVVLGVRP